MIDDLEFDETLTRFHRTGPEFRGWLSNHGPMAADALVRLDNGDAVASWTNSYLERLDAAPIARWTIAADEWRDPLGDPSRLGDWLAFFEGQLRDAAWRDVLAAWWPRLLPGAVASATHPLIRTGHAVRLLREAETPARISELAQALGYWAARWAPLPEVSLRGDLDAATALVTLPAVPDEGGARTRIAALDGSGWTEAAGAHHQPAQADQVPAALDRLVDAAVDRYGNWARADPVMLVHMATAPRAAGLIVVELPRELWLDTYRYAWSISSAIASMYRPAPRSKTEPAQRPATADLGPSELSELAARTGDAHAIKFTEVALESHQRQGTAALDAAALAVQLLSDS